MNRNILLYLVVLLFWGCHNDNVKYIELQNEDGQIQKGYVVGDSTFNGRVQLFDSSGKNLLGYTTFKYGYMYGPCVHFMDGKMIDSTYYKEPVAKSEEFIFSSNEKLEYKASLYGGRIVGPVSEYDKYGQVKAFYFFNFEGEIIYRAKPDSAGFFVHSGSIINVNINPRLLNDEEKHSLFLYIIRHPFASGNYYISVLNAGRETISTTKIETDDFFYETFLNPLPDSLHYAVVYQWSTLEDSSKKTSIVQEIFL